MTTRLRCSWPAATLFLSAALSTLVPALRAAEVALPDAWRARDPMGATAVAAVPDTGSIARGPQRRTAKAAFDSQDSLSSGAPAGRGGNGRRPHPAVVRVIAPERNGMSMGSGTLVHVEDDQGIVVTNWHVVRDATEPLVVVFPDGFRSPGRVLRADRNWDLAAVAIERPDVEPVPLATEAPQPGEALTIAGYGPGNYRAATGRCTQYLSPGRRLPFEMVEVSTAARQGDSGGPIFNRRGELAGVLFGATHSTTSGSYCLRVAEFLTPVTQDAGAGSEPVMVAARAARIERLPPVPHPHPHAGAIAAAAESRDYPATFAPRPDDLPGTPEGVAEPFDAGPQVADWRPGGGREDRMAAREPTSSEVQVAREEVAFGELFSVAAAAAERERIVEPDDAADWGDRYDTYADRHASAEPPANQDADGEATRLAAGPDDSADGARADDEDLYVPFPDRPIQVDPAVAQTAALTASLTPRIEETIVLEADVGEPAAAEPQDVTWQDLAGASLWDQAKSLLAMLGAIAVALHGLRWLKLV